MLKVYKMIINLTAKCSDLCNYSINDKDGKELFEHDGYVPDFMPGDHFGDYIELEIDSKTGKILNWRKDADKLINALIK